MKVKYLNSKTYTCYYFLVYDPADRTDWVVKREINEWFNLENGKWKLLESGHWLLKDGKLEEDFNRLKRENKLERILEE